MIHFTEKNEPLSFGGDEGGCRRCCDKTLIDVDSVIMIASALGTWVTRAGPIAVTIIFLVLALRKVVPTATLVTPNWRIVSVTKWGAILEASEKNVKCHECQKYEEGYSHAVTIFYNDIIC